MKRAIIGVLTLLTLCTGFMGCGESAANTMMTVDADGLVFEVGKTKVSEVVSNGYTYEWTSSVYQKTDKMDGRSFTTSAISIIKDGEEYVGSGLINKSSSQSPIDDCIIGDTTIYFNSEVDHLFTSVKIDEKDVAGKTKDEIKSLFEQEPNIDEDYLYYVKDKCSYKFEFGDDGKIKSLHIDVDENKL